MKIPVFVSCPTELGKKQEASRRRVLEMLDRLQLEPRAIGRSDYPTQLPLREVMTLATHCSGGVILGFSQLVGPAGALKRVVPKKRPKSGKPTGRICLPTPWNHLEAGILFSLHLPLLVFREDGISGGIFDNGVTDVFVHKMPTGKERGGQQEGLEAVFLKWQTNVRTHYYRERALLSEDV